MHDSSLRSWLSLVGALDLSAINTYFDYKLTSHISNQPQSVGISRGRLEWDLDGGVGMCFEEQRRGTSWSGGWYLPRKTSEFPVLE